jgi:hypothetical protein
VSYCGVSDGSRSSKKINIKLAVKKIEEQLLKGNFFIFESDISGFFDNIPKRKLYKKIKSILPDDSINELIHQVIFFKIGNDIDIIKYPGLKKPQTYYGIPQGSPLSALFSNLSLVNFDNKLSSIYPDQLIRYCDDFIIMCKNFSEAKSAGNLSKILLSKEHLETAIEKTTVIDLKVTPLIFLGLEISSKKITCKKSLGQLKTEFIQDILNYSKYKKLKKTSKIIPTINSRIGGWFNTYKIYHIDKLVDELIEVIEACKLRDPRLLHVQNINKNKISHFLSESEWKKIFQKII